MLQLAYIQNMAFSEHVNETGHVYAEDQVSYIDHDSPCNRWKFREASHIRFSPNNINRVTKLKFLTWMPTIKEHDSWLVTKRTYKGTTSDTQNNNEDQNAPMTTP